MLRTPMHVAASRGCIEALSWLVAQPGVDVNAVDVLGATPLEVRPALHAPAARPAALCPLTQAGWMHPY